METQFSVMYKPLEQFDSSGASGLAFAEVMAASPEQAQTQLEQSLGFQVAMIHVERIN